MLVINITTICHARSPLNSMPVTRSLLQGIGSKEEEAEDELTTVKPRRCKFCEGLETAYQCTFVCFTIGETLITPQPVPSFRNLYAAQ